MSLAAKFYIKIFSKSSISKEISDFSTKKCMQKKSKGFELFDGFSKKEVPQNRKSWKPKISKKPKLESYRLKNAKFGSWKSGQLAKFHAKMGLRRG